MKFFDYTSLEDEVVHGLTLLERFVPILILVILLYLVSKYKKEIRHWKYEKYLTITIAVLMMIGEFSYMIWNFVHSLSDRVYFISTLPFHLCSYGIWGIAFAMFFKNKKIFNYVFVFAILGSLALVFPNLNHGVNSFRYYQLYFSHSLLLISWLYMYKVHDYYPTKKDLITSFLILQIIIVYSILGNILLHTEFLFIGPGNKPIDFAWEWPLHMIQYEVVMVIVYFVTYQILKKFRYQKSA